MARLLEEGSDRWANRATAHNLAEGTNRADILARVQVRCAVMRKSADGHHRVMVVEDFDGKEVDFTREREANEKSVHPVSLSGFDSSSQIVPFDWL
jgi:hypothetical protein